MEEDQVLAIVAAVMFLTPLTIGICIDIFYRIQNSIEEDSYEELVDIV